MTDNLSIKPYGRYQWRVMFQWGDEPEPEHMVVFTKENDPERARAEADYSLSGPGGTVSDGYHIISVELVKEWDESDV